MVLIGEIIVRVYFCKIYNTDIFLTEFWKEDNLIHRPSNNHRLSYILKPNYHSREYSTNAFGFRDHAFQKTRPAGYYRILVLGDSVTFGQGVSQNQTLPPKLEKILNDSSSQSPHFEVLNAGVTGYNAYQEVEFFFEYGLQLNPDMVIFNYVLNDQSYEDGGLRWYFNRRKRFLLRKVLGRQIRKFYALFKNKKAKKSPPKSVSQKFGAVEESHYKPGVMERYSRALHRVKEACSKKNIKTGLIIFPLFRDIKKHPYKEIHQLVRETAEKNGFFVIDLWSAFKNYSRKEVYQEYLHPNARGFDVASKAVQKYMIERKLIPLAGAGTKTNGLPSKP
jgi:lysophospholipase L1-like esterase